MFNFRQKIRPGQKGSDVFAVKLAYKRIKVQDSKKMKLNKKAGTQFVHVTKSFQHNHGLKVTGIYNEETHNKLRSLKKDGKPAFSTWAKILYNRAKIRTPKIVNPLDLDAQEAAKEILKYHSQGKYTADNSGDLYDIQKTAQGLPVWSPLGYWVHIDKRPLQALVFLLEKGYRIGTFAICSDHHTIDGRHGHNGGHAIDISSINGVQVGSRTATSKANVLSVAKLLKNGMPHGLTPWQLICDGYGYIYDYEIHSLILPYPGFYNYSTLIAHRNHIHYGYFGD